jgi:ribosomal protein S18 acetylase RimI-like enzyme
MSDNDRYIQFERAVVADAARLAAVQDECFQADFVQFGFCSKYGRTPASMADSITGSYVYKIISEGQIIGDIIVSDQGNREFYLDCLCVVAAFVNQGIGQRAMQFIMSQFPDAEKWSLDTPCDRLRNLYFYKKHGFMIAREYAINGVNISHFEKHK